MAFAEPPPTLAVASQMQRQRYDNGIAVLEYCHKKSFFLSFLFPDDGCRFSVTVLQFSKGLSHTLKILLYLYINIESIF